jgi:hypothetical protein
MGSVRLARLWKDIRGRGMSRGEAVAYYRLYAAYCAEVARDPSEPGRKVALLNLAQAWLRLAEQVEKTSDDVGVILREQSSRHEKP